MLFFGMNNLISLKSKLVFRIFCKIVDSI